MAITPLSLPSTPSNALTALSDNPSSADSNAFANLFAGKLRGEISAEEATLLPDVLPELGQELMDQPLQENPLSAWLNNRMPTEIAEKLRGKPLAEGSEAENDSIALLGAFQIPVQLPDKARPLAELPSGRMLETGQGKTAHNPFLEPGLPTAQPVVEEALLQESAADAGNEPAKLAADERPFAQVLEGAHAAATTKTKETESQDIRTPVQSPRWSQEFGEKIVWMARNDQQQAQLNLNPAHLGPLQITLNLDADQASALFTSANPEVRQAIEEAMPRLREMLAGAGISLGQAQVGSQAPQDQSQHTQHGNGPARPEGDKAILEADTHTRTHAPKHAGLGLVDLFA